MWCNGSGVWMVIGSLSLVAFLGTVLWMLSSLLTRQRDQT